MPLSRPNRKGTCLRWPPLPIFQSQPHISRHISEISWANIRVLKEGIIRYVEKSQPAGLLGSGTAAAMSGESRQAMLRKLMREKATGLKSGMSKKDKYKVEKKLGFD